MTPLSRNTDEPPRRRQIFDRSFVILAILTLIAGIAVTLRDGTGAAWQVIWHNLAFLAILSPKIVAGVFAAAALPILIPREVILRSLGAASGLRGLAIATLAGMIVPGGPVMVFAVAASFLTAGVDFGSLVSFVVGWSLLGLNRTIIWELSFLPYGFVALRYAICLPLPILIGWAARRLVAR